MQCVLAVDGGNTKTIAVVAALDGTILGAGRGACGDIYNGKGTGYGSEHAAMEHVEDAVRAALRHTELGYNDIVAGVFNMAGADWLEDYALIEAELKARGLGQRILVQNDALGALHAGTAGNVGVSVVCGTGGATGSRGPDGRSWHSSFWQMSVQGSSMISHVAISEVVRSELGIEPPTSLTARIVDFFSLHSVEELLHNMTCRDHSVRPHRIDRLTPIIMDEADAGDELATRILHQHGRRLADYAVVAARKVGIEGTAFPLILAGGVFRHPSTIMSDALIERLRETSPAVQPRRARFEPVIGTLFSALELAGITLDEALLERLISTIPHSSLFETASHYTAL